MKGAQEELHIGEHEKVVALAGNPNVGKSTVFNYITGLKQHTGNWTGKTVVNAYGRYKFNGNSYIMADLPGTYSLIAQSKDEEAARDFICFQHADATIVVMDATTLERNMNLVSQVLEVTSRVVLCVNLIDEAKRKGILVDTDKMHKRLSVPVVATNAKSGEGIEALLAAVERVTAEEKKSLHIPQCEPVEQALSVLTPHTGSRWVSLKLLENDNATIQNIYRNDPALRQNDGVKDALQEANRILEEAGISNEIFREREVEAYYQFSEQLIGEVVRYTKDNYNERDRKIDRILTSKATGIPIMLGFLALILWITIVGANYPSELLSNLLFGLENKLTAWLLAVQAPAWVNGLFVEGMYRTLAWVISVMLPPMAIFFPLFTLLEDLGYLPRIAFNLDKCFCRARAHGKQALTMCIVYKRLYLKISIDYILILITKIRAQIDVHLKLIPLFIAVNARQPFPIDTKYYLFFYFTILRNFIIAKFFRASCGSYLDAG